ncbi:MAG: GAF domain-containing protein, partial [Kineosporiaceae bacterium]|nr:GAF domain-containing protein [Aeromicrobium sp.]
MAINIGGSVNPRWGEGRFAIVDERLTFPDESKGQLDKAISNLIEQAAEVLRSQGRLRALIRANQAVVEHLDLPTVLRTIVESAVELVDARYGALSVLGSDGGLEQFITVGMTPAEAVTIGAFPHGFRLFGALSDDSAPVYLEQLSTDPRTAGPTPDLPNMENFLGVPVRVRKELYGNLYLSSPGSGCFSAEDEQLVEALAATAGFAIDNARLYAETSRRQAWWEASAEITAALLSDGDEDSIDVLVRRVLAIADADLACVMLPTSDPDELIVDAVHGDDAATLRGRAISSVGSLAGCVLGSCQS